MKLETFFEAFELFADAPDAVASMRGLVLELAAKGTLVDQDPDEGDGFELLSQIHQKNPSAKPSDEEEAVAAHLPCIPSSWASSKLGDVAEIFRGVSFPGSAKSETRSGGDVACLRTASVQAEIDWDDLIYISPDHVSRSDQWVAANDIMISMANSYALVGKVAIVREVPQKATFGAFLAAIRTVLIEPYFLLYVLRSPRMRAAFRASSSQTTNIANISLGRMRPLPFPLPPFAEQKRIVAKVDELMALCDLLEAQQKERETRHTALARASLARFADAPSPANLDLLFHKSYSIAPGELRKSILALAVKGKLVPQDPNDEPADVLLAELRIQGPRDSGRRRKAEPLPEIVPDEIPFDLPPGWAWERLGSIGDTNIGLTYSPQDVADAGIPVLRSSNIQSGRLDFTDLVRVRCEPRQSVMVQDGDLLICVRNGSRALVGKVAVIENLSEPAAFGAFMAIFRSRMNPYLYYFICSPLFRRMIDEVNTTTINQITQHNLRTTLAPIPPLAEQSRIVAKTHELMALVDALETQLATARTTGATLVEAAVAELTAEA